MGITINSGGIFSVSSGNLTFNSKGAGGSSVAPTTVTNLEVDTDTVLLLHMNGVNNSIKFPENSFYPKVITRHGSAKISTSQSKFGSSSGYFNGTNSYLSVPWSSEFNLSSGDFTIEAWVYFNSTPGGSIIARDTYGSNFDWAINLGSNVISFPTNRTNSYLNVTVPTFNSHQWYHIAVVRYNGTNTIYLDGVSYGSNNMSITCDEQTGPTIGCSGWNRTNNFFNGYIDELRISKVARYTSNFTPPTSEFSIIDISKLPSKPVTGQVIYATEDGTVAYICKDAATQSWMRFDAAAATGQAPALLPPLVLDYDLSNSSCYSGSGSTVTDLKDTANATLANSPTYSNGYLTFDGSSQYLLTSSTVGTKVTTSATTISMWVYPMSNGVILSELGQPYINTGWHDSQIAMVGGTLRFSMWGGYYTIITSSIATPLNNWYHITITYDSSTLTAYVNGNLAGVTSFGRQAPGSQLYYAIAATDSTSLGDGNYSSLRLGRFQVYSGALNDDQVTNLFNSTSKNYGL